jgi:hypothetical protein
MSSADTVAQYAPEYASYNWTGAPADYSLTTNTDLGGDSRMLAATFFFFFFFSFLVFRG